MKPETIICDKNSYEIQQIELGAVNKRFYLKFYFADEVQANKFISYLKITLTMLVNEVDEVIQFKQLNFNQSSTNPVILIGNIKQAIKFLQADNVFSDKTKQILYDRNEIEIQHILNKSEKCTTFVLTVGDDKTVTDYQFFKQTSPDKSHKLVEKNSHENPLVKLFCLK